MINGDWKNNIRMMRANGNEDGAIRELRKIYMSEMKNLDSYMDKYFILFALAHLYYKKNKKDMSNYYLKELFEISNHDIQRNFKTQYYNIVWLNINLNHEDIDSKTIISDMVTIYNYYESIGEKDISLSALESIFYFEGNGEKVLESLVGLLECDKISDWNFVTSILKDCEKLSHNLYIKALEIVNKYNINIDVV